MFVSSYAYHPSCVADIPYTCILPRNLIQRRIKYFEKEGVRDFNIYKKFESMNLCQRGGGSSGRPGRPGLNIWIRPWLINPLAGDRPLISCCVPPTIAKALWTPNGWFPAIYRTEMWQSYHHWCSLLSSLPICITF